MEIKEFLTYIFNISMIFVVFGFVGFCYVVYLIHKSMKEHDKFTQEVKARLERKSWRK